MKKLSPWLGLVFRLVVGAVLLVAGYLKAFNPSKAKMAVRAYEALPIPVANILGVALPWIEIGAGLLLILGVAVRKTAIFSGFLMLIFIIAIAQAWARGLSIDCGCFGGGGQVDAKDTKYVQEILRDFGLGLMSLYLFRYPKSRFALEREKETHE
ncbi:MAG: DoxX family protein [Actinobacteria bacterium]|nr:DoxX family protein [Actinomycetota bacterium]